MTNDCNRCKSRDLPFLTSFESNDEGCNWYQWRTVTENFEERQVRKTVRRQVSGSVPQLKSDYTNAVRALKPHEYTIHTQYSVIAMKKTSLSDTEVLLHIDFSENLTVKSLSEVQSAHFGASLQQVTLHTGVAYVTGNEVNSSETLSYWSLVSRSHGN